MACGRACTAAGGLLVMAGLFAGTGPAAAGAASCQAWTGAQPPSPGTRGNFLSGVAVLSPCDAWAAGFDLSGGGAYQTLIEHWNGFGWAPVDSPSRPRMRQDQPERAPFTIAGLPAMAPQQQAPADPADDR